MTIRNVQENGAVVYWYTNGPVLRASLRAALVEWGLSSARVDSLVSVEDRPAPSLERAVKRLTGSRRGRKSGPEVAQTANGFEVIEVQKAMDGNDRYQRAHYVTPEGDLLESMSHLHLPETIRHFYEEEKLSITGSMMGIMATALADQELSGTKLRPSGGMYWLPAATLILFNDLDELLQNRGLGSLKLEQISSVMTEKSIAAVVAALVQEALVIREDIDQLISSNKKVPSAALASLANLENRVALYKDALGDATDQLTIDLKATTEMTVKAEWVRATQRRKEGA